MRILRVHVQNFRCLDDLELSFDDVTVVVGANSTGKSSVLRALDWFFHYYSLDDLDVGGRATDAEVSVGVTFGELSDRDLEIVRRYVVGGEVTVRRTWSKAEGLRVTSPGSAYPRFEKIRVQPRASDKNAAYRLLREQHPELDLPAARSADAVEAALADWERSNPEALVPSDIPASDLLGEIPDLFDYVLIPAITDPERETRDVGGTSIRKLIERSAPIPDNVRQRLQQLEDRNTQELADIMSAHGSEMFREVGDRITDLFERLVPGGSVVVDPQAPEVRIPPIGVRLLVADGGLETDVGRQGHGFQRALMIALVQVLAAGPQADAAPGLLLAIEEPELYQHPTQARHLSRTLADLASRDASGTQIVYATHSEHFIDPSRYEQLRRFRKRSGRRSWPTAAMTEATIAGVTRRLHGIVTPDQVKLRTKITLRRHLAEAVFARAVVLVEGLTDAALLRGLADRQNGFDPIGISVVVGNGKGNLAVPWAILTELGIPTYVLFDGDAGVESRSRANGKPAAEAEEARRKTETENLQLLSLLGAVPERQPQTLVSDSYAVFHDRLEEILDQWPGFAQRRKELAKIEGEWRDKSDDIYRQAACEAEDDPPEVLEHLLRAALLRADRV